MQWTPELFDYLVDELCLGSEWETVAACLNFESSEIRNALPSGHCPNDCAREFLRRCKKEKITFQTFVNVLIKKQLNNMVFKLEQRFRVKFAQSNDIKPAFTATVAFIPPAPSSKPKDPLANTSWRFQLAKAMGDEKKYCGKMLWELLAAEFNLGNVTMHLHAGHTVDDCNRKVVEMLYNKAITFEQISAEFEKWNCEDLLNF